MVVVQTRLVLGALGVLGCLLAFFTWGFNGKLEITGYTPKLEDPIDKECFPNDIIPLVFFIKSSFGGRRQCPTWFTITLQQAISSNGPGNVVLLEVGHFCKEFSESIKVRHYSIPEQNWEDWYDWVTNKMNHTYDRVMIRQPGWAPDGELPYYTSYYRIYAINEWVQARPCIKKVAHCDVDTMNYASVRTIWEWNPGYDFLAHMNWPLANHIWTGWTREALQDLVDFMNSGFSVGECENSGWGKEFTSDMQALASYVAYHIPVYPCWAQIPFGYKLPFGSCQEFWKLQPSLLSTPYTRPAHVPKFMVGSVAVPKCNITFKDCGFVSEALHLDREVLHDKVDGWMQVRWIKCKPYVHRLNVMTGEKDWVKVLAFHGQGKTKAVLKNYARPLNDPRCETEDCLCENYVCDNCVWK